MNDDSGETTSAWWAAGGTPRFPPLAADARADVCVVGAGIAGLTTAYLLAREGRSVVLLDDGPVAGGESGRTSAHLSNALDDRYLDIEQRHGKEGAQLAAESHTRAIDQIERIVEDEAIDADFRRVDGYLVVPPGDPVDVLHEEFDAGRRAGLHDIELVDRVPYDGYDFGTALRFPRQAQFHALK